jgi:hypothetical protein
MRDDMSYILQTPEECLLHAKITAGRGRSDLAAAAYKRAFHLMAARSGITSEVERECWAGTAVAISCNQPMQSGAAITHKFRLQGRSFQPLVKYLANRLRFRALLFDFLRVAQIASFHR